ncbi:MAG: ATP-binding cassette domain-containing protein [Acetobacteraceae bacterium]
MNRTARRGGLRRLFTHPLLIMAVVFAVLPFLLPAFGSTVSLATEIEIYALYGIGFNLLLGYTGLVSFGASAYFGLASYAAGEAFLHLIPNMYFDLFVGTVFGGVVGVAVGALILRRRGLYFALLTLAFTQLFYEIAFRWTSFTGGENGLQGVNRTSMVSPLAFHFFTGVVVIIACWLLWRIAHAPFGRTLQAIRDNEQRVRYLGYDTFAYKLACFSLSSVFIAFAGSLLTFLIEGAYADNLNWVHAGDPVMMTILGGIHSYLGPLWGSAIFLILSDQLSALTEHWWLIFGAILIAFVLLSPEGVSGIVGRLMGNQDWHLTWAKVPHRSGAGGALRGARPAQSGNEPLLIVKGLRKRFGHITVADGVDFTLLPGELHSLIGPNGAGKTTFFNMLTGLVPSDEGTIRYRGRDITTMPVHRRIRLGIARSFQIVTGFPNLTVFETVRVAVQTGSPGRHALWRDAYKLPRVIERTWELLDIVGLADRASDSGAGLSHGERRVLDLAVTLATEPDVLLLDEPLAGLGDAEREEIGHLIRQLAGSHAILLIEHDIDRVLAISDRITVLHQGRVIAEGKPQEIVNDPEVVNAYLGQHGARNEATPGATRRGGQSAEPAVLHLSGLVSGYHGSRVLQGVDLEVRRGEVVALLGRNGVGKTTTLRTIMGTVKPIEGRIRFENTDITGWTPDRVNRRGISIVPEGRRIFPNLTVLDNLLIAQRPGGWNLEETYGLFPKLRVLAGSRGRELSGGEQQMLAIARALAAPTSLVLLDEPLEGLAPAIVMEVLQAIVTLRERASILIVEQKVDLVLPFAERAYVMVSGRIAHEGDAASLLRDRELQERLLGVGA